MFMGGSPKPQLWASVSAIATDSGERRAKVNKAPKHGATGQLRSENGVQSFVKLYKEQETTAARSKSRGDEKWSICTTVVCCRRSCRGRSGRGCQNLCDASRCAKQRRRGSRGSLGLH